MFANGQRPVTACGLLFAMNRNLESKAPALLFDSKRGRTVWIVPILACFPIVMAVAIRLQVANVWRRAAKELDGSFTKPRFADAFVCRDFAVDGKYRKASVRMKTVEGHMPDDENLSRGFLGWVWDRMFASKSAYGVRIVVEPIEGVIPTNLTLSAKVRQSSRVNPKHWSDQVEVHGKSYGLLAPPRRPAIHRVVVQYGATVTGGVVVLTRPGPLFDFENCRKIIKDMAKACESLTMSFNAWSNTMELAPNTPKRGVTPVSVGNVRSRSKA